MLASRAAFVLSVSMTFVGSAAAYVPYRSDTGNVYRWPQSCVSMVAYPNDLVGMMPVEEIMGALDASAGSWSKVSNPCTYLDIAVTHSTGETPRATIDSRNNIIFRTTSWCKLTNTGACDPLMPYDPSTLALTSVSAGSSSGIIRDVDLEVNAFGFNWADLVAHPDLGGMSFHDLQNAVTHEMGHVIGLVHTCYLEPPPDIDDMGQPIPDCGSASADVRATTMFPSANPGDVEKRTLEADDKRGLCETYPAAQDPVTCGESMQDGCTSCTSAGAPASGAGSVLMLAATSAALRVRRRRRPTRGLSLVHARIASSAQSREPALLRVFGHPFVQGPEGLRAAAKEDGAKSFDVVSEVVKPDHRIAGEPRVLAFLRDGLERPNAADEIRV
jgi:hypothetical protein